MSASYSTADTPSEMFVLFSLAYACASRSPAEVISVVIPTILQMPIFAEGPEKRAAEEAALTPVALEWRSVLRNYALKFAQDADDAGVNLTDYPDIVRHGHPTLAAFMTDFIDGAVPASAVVVVSQSADQIANSASEKLSGSIADAIEQWVTPATSSEQSRRRSAVHQFIEAVGFDVSCPVISLAGIPPRAADLFLRYAAAHPLKPRGEQGRLAHIDKFLAAMRNTGVPIPPVDWEVASTRGAKSK